MNNYNIENLKNDAHFEIPIYSDIFWVPYNCLGKTKYTNNDMIELINCGDNIKNILTTPYEIAQYIKNARFIRFDDCIVDKNIYMHQSGYSALIKKRGSCSSFSGAFYYLLHDIYTTYNLCILNNKGTGHAMNIIKQGDYFYFFDLYSQLSEFSENAAVESGNKIDFTRSGNMFASCLKTYKVENYFKLIEKKNVFKKREWFYFLSKADVLPSLEIEHDDLNGITVTFNKNDITKWYLKPDVKSIKLNIIGLE
jgi:hypothetical protein